MKPSSMPGLVGRIAIWAFMPFCLAAAVRASSVDTSWVQGQVVDSVSQEPLEGAAVTVVDRFSGALCDKEGRFIIKGLTEGIYALRVSHIGHATRTLDSVVLPSSGAADLRVKLAPQPVELRGIVVTPGSYSFMGDAPVATQTMSSREIRTKPQLGDDFFRAINRLPGLAGNDFSARFAIRGGEFDEVLVTLDGLQITEPFHLKDVDGGAMSIIDVASVDDIELMTGGFSAAYGNKMSGVLDIRSRRVPPGKSRLSLAASMLNTRALAEGVFDNNRGSWLVSARRGYIDFVLKLAGEGDGIKPTYYDAFGKVQYQLTDKHIFAAHLLHARDRLRYGGDGGDTGDTLLTNYGSSYGWLTLWSQLRSGLTNQLIIAAGISDHHRRGQGFENSALAFDAHDRRDAHFWRVKSDMEWAASARLLLKWGGEYERRWADFDYFAHNYYYDWRIGPAGWEMYLLRADTIEARPENSDSRLSGYVSARMRLAPPLVTEIGMRYDRLSHTGDNLTSPRISLAYEADERTTWRAAWGVYYQPEGIDEIAAYDGERYPFPAQKAEHRVVGLEHDCTGGARLRIEVYEKKYTHLRPVYRNMSESIELFPEREKDRTYVYRERTNSKGIEFLLKKDAGGKLSWWLSYAIAKVEDSLRYLYFPTSQDTAGYGIKVPTPKDQRHTVCLDIYYRPTSRWQLGAAIQYHSGWPRTDVYLRSADTPSGKIYWGQSGFPWAARYEPYRRVDFRVDRYFPIKRGRITVFVEVLNVFNYENVRAYSYNIYPVGGTVELLRSEDYWLGTLPSFGISYEVAL